MIKVGSMRKSKSKSSVERSGSYHYTDEVFSVGCLFLLAASKGDEAKVQLFLSENEEMLHFVDYDKRSALHVAASEGQMQMVKLLHSRGAVINRIDRWGGTPLDDAMRHRREDVAAYLRENGGTLGISTAHANSLIEAASMGDVEAVQQMLIDGVPANGADYDLRSPMHLASSEGHAEVVKLLLRHGADVNAADRWGHTPMDDAMRKNHEQCVQLLREAGSRASAVRHSTFGGGDVDEVEADTQLEQDALHVDWAEVEVLDKIGAGAFGDIYKARWRGTPVAAKVLKHIANADDHEMALHDLKVECMLLRQLRHPNICMVLGICLTVSREVMLSELMKCSLADLLKTYGAEEKRMPTRLCMKYTTQFAQGMNYLHLCKPPILHRDLKPANLLLDYSDTLKVADFGLAKLRPLPKAKPAPGERQMTGETGSYRFMAPEVYRHEEYSEKVDVYSFAIVTYNVFSGMTPWHELNGVEAARAAAYKASRPAIPRHWDAALHALLQDAWAPEPAQRPSFGQILGRLCAMAEGARGGNAPPASSACAIL